MSPLRLRSLPTGLLAMLASCMSPAQTDPPPVAQGPPLAIARSIDGSYNGVAQLASGSPDACGTQDIFSLKVRANAFKYVLQQPQVPWRPSVTFAVSIAPDGSFASYSGTAYIKGQVKQGHMQGQIVGDSCAFSFEADNTGSF
jgi:hypothetical protein